MKCRTLPIILALLLPLAGYADERAIDLMRKSLIRILATTQAPDYRVPWNPGQISAAVGSGFVIDDTLIMTNAHVVSNSRFLTVSKDGDPRNYTAAVVHIAHDCDLALLAVNDSGFFAGTQPLSFGGIPELHSTVTTYGYPIGGERMSVTRGVVSRIEFQVYSHSALDAHLSVQIDAAINPGNSGGPVMQGGNVVGVVFQGYSGAVAQNTGYMIPTPVIQRFLRDCADGRYDGYVELGITYHNLLNPSYRRALNLPEGSNNGIVVTDVLAAGSANGSLQAGDVLLAIDGYPINSDGHIELEGEYLQMEEVVERKFHGDTVRFQFIRANEVVSAEIILKGAWPYAMLANQYDQPPEFVLFAGLLFQPLSRNFLNAYKNDDLDLSYYYRQFVVDEMYLTRPQIVVLSAVLPDAVNAYYGNLVNEVIDTVNGQAIRTVGDLADCLRAPAAWYVFKLIGKETPIVIEASQAHDARQRIKDRYGVVTEQYIAPPRDENAKKVF